MKIYHLQNYTNNRTATIQKEDDGSLDGKYTLKLFHQGKIDWMARGCNGIFDSEKDAIETGLLYICKEK